MERNFLYYTEVDSTSEEIKRLAEAGNATPFLTVVAKRQSAGRGRRGRTWHSPENGSLYMSVYVPVSFSLDQASMTTILMACSVKRVLQELGTDAQLKWPNDLVIAGKKVCGILAELQCSSEREDYIVMGVGVNISSADLPQELEGFATDIFSVCKENIDSCKLAEQIWEQFVELYHKFCEEGNLQFLKQEYESSLVNIGEKVKVLEPGCAYEGVALGIDDIGRLLVKKENGELSVVYAGEVSVRGIYGYV